MKTQQEKLKRYVEAAIADFNANEQYLVRNDLSERCICAKFATYIEKQIVVFRDDECKRPYAIVECKRDGITDAEFNQAVEQGIGNAS